jgi:hypothetical protein
MSPEEEPTLQEISLPRHLLTKKNLICLVLAFFILYLLMRKAGIKEFIEVIEKTNWLFYSFGFILFYLSIILRGIRFKILLGNIGISITSANAAEILFISWFINCIIPAKLGDIYRSYLIKKNYRFSASKTLGAVLIERVFDIIILVILFIGSAILFFGKKTPESIRNILIASMAMAMILVVGLFCMKHFGKSILKFLPSMAKAFYKDFEIGSFQAINRIPLVAFLTIIPWILEIGRFFFVVQAVGLEINLFLVVFVALASSLLTTLPLTPAGLGAVEGGIVGILALSKVDTTTALSVAMLDRTISFWSIILLGYLTFVFSKRC